MSSATPTLAAVAAADVRLTTQCIDTLPALERELKARLLQEWTDLVRTDPLASCFQAPGWCVPWYRSYHDEFDPFVVVVRSGGALAGIVPLAVRRLTREVLFASGTMADYRDIVALPAFRRRVVAALIETYVSGRFSNPLEIGWLDAASDTASLVDAVCRERGVRYAAWRQPCHRWVPRADDNLQRRFKRVRTHVNALKRCGELQFEIIATPDRWRLFRDEFYRQHSAWQRRVDRHPSFDDPRKQRFYERLFEADAPRMHATALRLDGELIAAHVGFVWRDILMLGAPCVAAAHEQRSPSLVLLTWIMQQAPGLGLRGLDLTIGDTEFKRRLGNTTVPVTMLAIHPTRRSYEVWRVRRESIAIMKGVVAAVWGRDAWKRKVLPAASRLTEIVSHGRARRTGATSEGAAEK